MSFEGRKFFKLIKPCCVFKERTKREGVSFVHFLQEKLEREIKKIKGKGKKEKGKEKENKGERERQNRKARGRGIAIAVEEGEGGGPPPFTVGHRHRFFSGKLPDLIFHVDSDSDLKNTI